MAKSKLILGIAVLLISSLFLMCRNNPTLTINIQPIDMPKVDTVSVNKLSSYLKELGLKNYKINILPEIKAPDNSYRFFDYEDLYWWRLRADSLIHFLNTPNKNEFTIGITDADISCSVHNTEDFGVLGLSYLGNKYNACVVSTHRLKDDNDLWKLMIHEFAHGYFNMHHCKSNNKNCIMQDANKKPNFAIKDSICNECLDQLFVKTPFNK